MLVKVFYPDTEDKIFLVVGGGGLDEVSLGAGFGLIAFAEYFSHMGTLLGKQGGLSYVAFFINQEMSTSGAFGLVFINSLLCGIAVSLMDDNSIYILDFPLCSPG